MISLNSHKNSKAFTLALLVSLLMLSSLFGRRSKPAPPPSLVRDVDILLWDEDHLRGYNGNKTSSRGEAVKNFKAKSTWTLTTEFWGEREWIGNNVFNGKYGKTSGKTVYTTYRPILQLSNEEYAEGKLNLTKIFSEPLLEELIWGNEIFISDYNLNNHDYRYELKPVILSDVSDINYQVRSRKTRNTI